MDKESLQEKTVAELREEAKKIPDAKGLSSMKKDDLIELILAHAGAAAPGKPAQPSSPGKKKAAGTTGGGETDKSALKERIQALKKDQREALAADDHNRARECNREIHRCKRILRKMARGKK